MFNIVARSQYQTVMQNIAIIYDSADMKLVLLAACSTDYAALVTTADLPNHDMTTYDELIYLVNNAADVRQYHDMQTVRIFSWFMLTKYMDTEHIINKSLVKYFSPQTYTDNLLVRSCVFVIIDVILGTDIQYMSAFAADSLPSYDDLLLTLLVNCAQHRDTTKPDDIVKYIDSLSNLQMMDISDKSFMVGAAMRWAYKNTTELHQICAHIESP